MRRAATPLALLFSCMSLLLVSACGGTSPSATIATSTATLATGPTTPLPLSSADWPTYHQNSSRTGYVSNFSDPRGLSRLWSQKLNGAVYAEPLVVAGHVIVATEGDTLYSLDAGTGSVQWRTTVGTPVPLGDLPCGDIDPLGITGTPVYDPETGLVYAVAETLEPGNAVAHLLIGIDAATGQIKVRRSVDPPGADPRVHQQRGALALLGNLVYVPFGGLDGDCGDYHGLVVGSRADGSGALLIFQVPTARTGGIWATPGPVIDSGGNLYVSVGNGAATSGTWDDSDSVLRLSAALNQEGAFAPNSWASDNANDRDLGSMGPVLLPGGLVYADGKSGNGYLLLAGSLGGVGGQLQTLPVCAAFGGAAVRGDSLYVPCTDGLQQLQLSGSGSQARLAKGWKAQSQITGSPVIGASTVYSLDPGDGVLYALNSTSGAVRARLTVGTASRFATPTLYQSTVLVGTMTGVVAVSIR